MPYDARYKYGLVPLSHRRAQGRLIPVLVRQVELLTLCTSCLCTSRRLRIVPYYEDDALYA
jgi:hypothetical protein